MKRILIPLLSVLFCALLITPAFAMVEQSESFYVADEANVLSDELENRIIAMNGELESQCQGAQLVVVTTDYLDGLYADEYANQLFYNWGVGDARENNGMLLLLAPAENKGWLAVGAGITDDFTDNMANDYLDQYLWEDFDNGDYEAGTEKTVEALYDWFLDFYDAAVIPEQEPIASVSTGIFAGLGSLILLPFRLIAAFLPAIVIIAVIVVFASIGGGRRRRSYHYHPGHSHYGVGGFWHRPPHRHRPPPPPPRPPMGGGFGSSPRPGSSFSSRPGSFGGGGAGRSGRSSSSRPSSSRPRSSGGGGRAGGGGGRR